MEIEGARVMEVSADWRMGSSSADALGQALGLLEHALAVVDQDGTILFATTAAERILRGTDGARVREALRIRRVTDGGHDLDLEVPRMGRLPVSLRVQSLEAGRGEALIALHDPEQAVRLDISRLAALYALTPTEALVAAAIAEGETLASFACAKGCSEQTARTHLKRVLSKTGCARQADLVRLALSNPLLRRRASAQALQQKCA